VTRNAADPKQIEAQKEADKLALKQDAEDLRWLMGDARGRRVVWDLLGKAGLYSSVFNNHGGVMNLNEGKRLIGLDIHNRIMATCPELYHTMSAEAARAAKKQLAAEEES
jgi:hypothetical protein